MSGAAKSVNVEERDYDVEMKRLEDQTGLTGSRSLEEEGEPSTAEASTQEFDSSARLDLASKLVDADIEDREKWRPVKIAHFRRQSLITAGERIAFILIAVAGAVATIHWGMHPPEQAVVDPRVVPLGSITLTGVAGLRLGFLYRKAREGMSEGQD